MSPLCAAPRRVENRRNVNDDITYIALANHRAKLRPFGIKQRDRRSHMYIIGKTGTGKSTLLRVLLEQDILAGRGVALLDPHGDLVEGVLGIVPEERREDLVYLDATPSQPKWTFNPFAGVPVKKRALAAAGMVEVFRKLWPDDWGPRLEHLLRNVVFTLLEAPGSTFGHVPRLLTDRSVRRRALEHVTDEVVRDFWLSEYERYSQRFRSVVIAPLQNKIGAMLADPRLRRVLTAEQSSFNLSEVMDLRKVLLVNLSKGQIGEGPAALLGSLVVSHLGLSGIARADQPESQRSDFIVYLDEFQTFGTRSLANMLAELRKYRVSFTLSHQFLSQLVPDVRDAVIGNVGTMIVFRLGAADAPFVARELAPVFDADDLIRLPNFHVYLKLLIGGQPSKPFSAQTSKSLTDLGSHTSLRSGPQLKVPLQERNSALARTNLFR